MARYLVHGVDLWLNTPRMYQEASGTSGMKAALNGVPISAYWMDGGMKPTMALTAGRFLMVNPPGCRNEINPMPMTLQCTRE